MINRQRHKNTCGIVASFNAMNWLGIKTNYNDLLEYSIKKLDFNHESFFFCDVKNLLKINKVKTRVINNFTFDTIHEEIDKGNTLIILYKWSNKGVSQGHFSFITGYTNNFFIAWNDSKKNITPYRSKRILAKDLRYSFRWCNKEYPKAIVIIGKNNL